MTEKKDVGDRETSDDIDLVSLGCMAEPWGPVVPSDSDQVVHPVDE